MATRELEVSSISAPTKLGLPFFRQTIQDWFVTAVLGAACFVALIRYDIFGLIVAGAPSLWLWWPCQYGKRYFMLWEDTVVSWWYLVVLEGYLWENKDHPDYVPRKVVWWKRALKWMIRISHPYPYSVDSLDKLEPNGDTTQYGLTYTPKANSYTAIVESGGSKLPNLSLDDQASRLSSIADEIQRFAYDKELSARASFEIMRRPANMVAHAEVVDLSLVPDVVVPKALLKLDDFVKNLPLGLSFNERISLLRAESDRLYADKVLSREETRDFRLFLSSQEAEQAVRAGANDPWMVALITIRRDSRLEQASKGVKPLMADEGSQQNIITLIDTFCRQLSVAGVHEPHVLNRDESEDFLAAASHVVMLDEYRERAAADAPDAKLDVYHPQIAMEVTKDLAIIDGTGHAVFKVTRLPASILPNATAKLVNGVRDVRWMSRTVISESATGNNEYRALVVLRNTLDDFLGFTGLRIGRKTELRQIGAQEREDQLAEQGHVEYVTIYIGVAAQNPVDIAKAAVEIDKAVRDFSRTAGCIRVTGAARMMRLAMAATTGIPY